MTTIRVPIVAVDAVHRVSLIALGQGVECNYPAWQVEQSGQWVGADIDTATHAAWDDHRFTGADLELAAAIASAPERIPLDTTGMDRAAVLALYPEVTAP